jgi:hypothetical protein
MLSVNYKCDSRNMECNASLLSITCSWFFAKSILDKLIILYVCTYYSIFKSVSDPVPLRIQTTSDIRKNLHPHPHPCIIHSAPNLTKESGLGYGKDIIRTNPIRFHP